MRRHVVEADGAREWPRQRVGDSDEDVRRLAVESEDRDGDVVGGADEEFGAREGEREDEGEDDL